jgi:putative Mn2+ efflux pump MntP
MDLSLLYGVHNKSFFDSYWSAVHFLTGIGVGSSILYLLHYFKYPVSGKIVARIGCTILLVWEYFEVILRYLDTRHLYLGTMLDAFLPHGFFEIESTTNIVSDLILGGLGLYVVYYFWKKDEHHE